MVRTVDITVERMTRTKVSPVRSEYLRIIDRRGVYGVIEEDVTRIDRTAVVVKIALKLEGYLGSFGNVDIEIGANVVLLKVDIGVEIVHPLIAHQSVVLIESRRKVVARHLAAAADVEVHALVHGRRFEHFFNPVHRRINIRITVRIHRSGNLGLRVRQNAEGITRRNGLVIEPHISNRISDINHSSRHRPCILNAHRDPRRTFTPLFRSNQNHSVSSTRTVKRRSNGVLHDRKTLDVIGLETSQIVRADLHTVNQHQWTLPIAERCYTANEELGVVTSGLTAGPIGHHTRHTPYEGCSKITARNLQFGRFHRRNRTHNTLFLLPGKSDDRHILERRGLLLHHDSKLKSCSDDYRSILHTEKRGNQYILRCRLYLKESVGTCNDAASLTLHLYDGSNKGRTLSVNNPTLNSRDLRLRRCLRSTVASGTPRKRRTGSYGQQQNQQSCCRNGIFKHKFSF